MKFKKPKIKIGVRLAIGYLVVIVLFTLFFYLNNREYQGKSIEEAVTKEVDYSQSTFNYLKERDINTLSAALSVITQDTEIKKIYLEKDRNKLYDYNEPLFKNLKEKYGITHWYFISPDGRIFLRMHDKDLYDDEVKRFTYKQAKATEDFSSGIELGKTAYALRVVVPYYQNKELIGFVELGEEIGHFLKILKANTGNSVSILADKKFLNENDWASVRQAAGLRNNWADSSNHLATGMVGESAVANNCFKEENIEQAEQGQTTFPLIQIGDKNFGCGGFAITDASGQYSGALMLVADISDHAAIAQKVNRNATIFLTFVFGLALSVAVLFSRSISDSIKKLSEGAAIISQGNLDYHVAVKTGDEIEQLGNDFNEMADKLKKSHDELEEKVRQRTSELEEAKTSLELKIKERTKELEKSKDNIEQQVDERTKELKETINSLERFDRTMANRELRMIELKERIKELEAELGKKGNI